MYLESAYGNTAQDAVEINPRDFYFVLNCEDYQRESHRLEIVMWPANYSQKEADDALANLATSPLGKARLTILKSKVSRAEREIEGKDFGKIDWLKFKLDIGPPTHQR